MRELTMAMRMTRRAALSALAIVLLARSSHAADPADACAAAKLAAASKKLASKVACYGKAAKSGVIVDGGCLAKAEQKFGAAFTAAEVKGGCRTLGDAAQVEEDVDAIVATLVADEPGDCGDAGDSCNPAACCPGLECEPVESVCQTTTTTNSTTTTFLPSCFGMSAFCNGACPVGQHCALSSDGIFCNCF